MTNTSATAADFDPTAIERPDDKLLTYYTLIALLTVVGFPFVFLPFLFKFKTLRYKFDDTGVSMSWGFLFKREVYLTYRRIQDIHVTRNLFHRWLGLADVSVQTASGSAGAEMTIEGIRNPEALRDFLYAKMRGVTEDPTQETRADQMTESRDNHDDDALTLLREIRDLLTKGGSDRSESDSEDAPGSKL